MLKTRFWPHAVSALYACASGLLLFSSCGGKAEQELTPFEQFTYDYADAACSYLAGCCEAAEYPYDTAQCISWYLGIMESDWGEVAATPGVYFDAEQADRCLQSKRRADCRPNASVDRAACLGYLRGTYPVGSACVTSSQCASEPGESAACVEGKCTTLNDATVTQPVDAKLGDACSGTCEVSEHEFGGKKCTFISESSLATCSRHQGLYCDSASKGCKILPKLGESCTSMCTKDAHCVSGVCIAKTADGPCTAKDDEACVDTSWCDTEARRCQPRLANGEPCSLADECLSRHCNRICREDSIARPKLCMMQPCQTLLCRE